MNLTILGQIRPKFKLGIPSPGEAVIALAGNPNTGKSTIFNALTGMRQHTGNWPGKTVTQALGKFNYGNRSFTIVDLPGTYSLFADSPDEQITRDFICFGHPDVTIVVTDATCLERNLNLVLQVIEITPKVVVCVNLIDEAIRKSIFVDINLLSRELGVPVVATVARNGKGLERLKRTVDDISRGKVQITPRLVRYSPELETLVEEVEKKLQPLAHRICINPRWLALRFIGGDKELFETLQVIMDEGNDKG
jgi:Fe2+ transport system protein B